MQLEMDLENKKRIIKEVKTTYYETFDEDGRRRINKVKEVKKWAQKEGVMIAVLSPL